MNLRPEQQTEIRLYGWLTSYGYKVYFNREDKEIKALIGEKNFKTFKIIGSKNKPDLVVFGNGHCSVIEVKSTLTADVNIRNGTKILDYHDEYVNKIARYFIDDIEIYMINDFLIGTDSSPSGHIYRNLNIQDHEHSQKKVFVGSNIPRYEDIQTGELIRSLWQKWKTNKVSQHGVGLLLSSYLDDLKSDRPKVFKQQFVTRWWQRWTEL